MRRSVGFAVVALLALHAPARAVNHTWTGGGGANTNWSNGANWGGVAPANNETGVTLVFPALGGPYASHNDRSGLRVVSLSVTTQVGAGTFTFTGNSIALSGVVTMARSASATATTLWCWSTSSCLASIWRWRVCRSSSARGSTATATRA
jgi:hypothetical protein